MPFTAKVLTTSDWKAKPPKVSSFERTIPRYVVIHHTTNQNPPNDTSEGTLTGAKKLSHNIQSFHMGKKRNWFDSGHNFLNSTGGFILEARHGSLEAVKQGFSVQSAHAADSSDPSQLKGGNESPGIENEGNFMTFQMGEKQWDSLVELCASLCDSCDISPIQIRGHREFSKTNCPGDWLFSQLPRLRKAVADKLGQTFEPNELENESLSQVLKFGNSGAKVNELQRRLQEKGFEPGSIDGIFGEITRAALIKFQLSEKLEGDGIAGKKTLEALGLS